MMHNLGLHFYTYGAAQRQVAIGIGHQYIGKLYFVTSVAAYVRHIQCLVFLYLKLLAGYFYYCEHNGSKIRTAKVQERFKPANKYLQKEGLLGILTLSCFPAPDG
jgi:hypothetical protein